MLKHFNKHIVCTRNLTNSYPLRITHWLNWYMTIDNIWFRLCFVSLILCLIRFCKPPVNDYVTVLKKTTCDLFHQLGQCSKFCSLEKKDSREPPTSLLFSNPKQIPRHILLHPSIFRWDFTTKSQGNNPSCFPFFLWFPRKPKQNPSPADADRVAPSNHLSLLLSHSFPRQKESIIAALPLLFSSDQLSNGGAPSYLRLNPSTDPSN